MVPKMVKLISALFWLFREKSAFPITVSTIIGLAVF